MSQCFLKIQEYEVSVHLGCSTEEQKFGQPIQFDFEINFSSEVSAMQSDDLGDTVDYVEITQIMKFIATSKKYHLIEHLNQQVMGGLISYLRSRNIKGSAVLSVKKIRVPIDNLRNGVVFSCREQI